MQGTDQIQVTLRRDDALPLSLRWQEHTARVLSVEAVQTHGLERRYRLRTTEGPYEVSLHTGAGVWQVLRGPGWLGRLLARVDRVPRFPLPAWQRRRRAPRGAERAVRVAQSSGGSRAVRLALVRQ